MGTLSETRRPPDRIIKRVPRVVIKDGIPKLVVIHPLMRPKIIPLKI